MALFTYTAITPGGGRRTGEIEAESRAAALERLHAGGLSPLALSERDAAALSAPGPALARWARDLADLLSAAVPLPEALRMAAEGAPDALVAATGDAAAHVEAGGSLERALAAHPGVFGALVLSMVRAGEAGGALPEALSRLADFLEADAEARSRLRLALAYPAFIAAAGVVTAVFLLLFVTPRLAPLFSGSDVALPWATRAMLGASQLLIAHGVWLGPALVTAIWAARRRFGGLSAALVRRLPVAGALVGRTEAARAAGALALLAASGVPLPEALAVAGEPAAARRLETGEPLHRALESAPRFPARLRRLVQVGETSGEVERSIERAARAMERDAARELKLAATLLEPAMILVVGGLVGLMVVAMLLPILDMSAFVK